MNEPSLSEERKIKLISILSSLKENVINSHYNKRGKSWIDPVRGYSVECKLRVTLCNFLNGKDCSNCWINWFLSEISKYKKPDKDNIKKGFDGFLYISELRKSEEFNCYPLYLDVISNDDKKIMEKTIDEMIKRLKD